TVAANWAATEAKLVKEPEAARVYLPSGRAPRLGETVRFPELATTFRAVAEGGAAAFYEGEFAGRLIEEMRARGASWSASDLAGHCSTWDEPISVAYRGHRLFECPPNGQGLAALSALAILDGLSLG